MAAGTSANAPVLTRDKITELAERGFCVLTKHLQPALIQACCEAFRPTLLTYLETRGEAPNRGPHRHYLPMPFDPPCFSPDFFFDAEVLRIVSGAMDDRVVADQWGCDVPVCGSQYQEAHVDFQRPLFAELPDLELPTYLLMVSFGLVPINLGNGPIEIAPGTHRMPRREAISAVRSGEIAMQPILLDMGDVLIRHPWALHRGTPNATGVPRSLVSIRYVRRWYADDSREVSAIPAAVWKTLTPEQQSRMRFPLLG